MNKFLTSGGRLRAKYRKYLSQYYVIPTVLIPVLVAATLYWLDLFGLL